MGGGRGSHTNVNCSDLKLQQGAGETAQLLRALAALLEDPSSVPSTHVGQLPVICNSNSGDSIPMSGLCGHLHMHIQAHRHTHTQK